MELGPFGFPLAMCEPFWFWQFMFPFFRRRGLRVSLWFAHVQIFRFQEVGLAQEVARTTRSS